MSKKTADITTELSVADLRDPANDPWFYAQKDDGTVDYKVKKSTLMEILGIPKTAKIGSLSQSGSAIPSGTELVNTIGTLTWSRTSAGEFLLTSPGAFPDATKVWLTAPKNEISTGHFIELIWNDADSLYLTSCNSSGVPTDGFNNLFIQIEVYK